MEPRIATLLGDSPLDRPSTDPPAWVPSLPPPPPSSVAPRRPHPVEPSTANDHVRSDATSSGSSLLAPSRPQQSPTQQAATKRQKPSAPIASVLNTVTPFSGRLSDLLLDASQQQWSKRRRIDEAADPPAPSGAENSLLTLPKPHQQPKKNTKRPRIPPLLQGLHQPPPQNRLFPPITSESGAFGRNLGDGVGLPNVSGSERRTEQSNDPLPNAAVENRPVAMQEESRARPKGQSASTSDKENRSSAYCSATASKTTTTKELRKRNKWSDQETKDLLVGVSRFGIGSWKKILQCPDFTFNQRTAVDLKDRFRTCCPGEGLKPRKPKRKGDIPEDDPQGSAVSFTVSSMSSNQDPAARETFHTAHQLRKNRGDSHRKGPAELREMGIHGTFTKNNRRERRAFTEQDDENLLKGFQKYASSWHLMRDDKELGFSARQPTDLRDRFRIRYPEQFAKAGYKLKPKDELMLKEKEKEASNGQDPAHTINGNSQGPQNSTTAKDATTDTSFSSLASTASSNPHLMPSALRESFLTSFAGPLEDFGDHASEVDGDNGGSPIILNRNIFEWADANPSQMPSVSAANLSITGNLASDAPVNILNGADGMHINQMVNLDLPMALLNSNILSAPPLQSSGPHQPSSSRLPEPYQHNTTPAVLTSTASNAMNTSTATAKHTINPLLRTPNLPTIVFPRVPASSARSAVHNLPPPTDLLSGRETDTRPEVQTAPFGFDDGFGLTLPSANATGYTPGTILAPMNGMSSREMLTLEKGLLQEPGRPG